MVMSLFTVVSAHAQCIQGGECLSELELLLQAEDGVVTTPANATYSKVSEEETSGISISVDGETLIGSPDKREQNIVRTDYNLNAVDIQVKFDGLDVTRRLSVSTHNAKRRFQSGEIVNFQTFWNYPQFIERAEVHIYRQSEKQTASAIAQPLEIIAIPVSGIGQGSAQWTSFSNEERIALDEDKFTYILRVYDAQGRFDETTPLSLQLASQVLPEETNETDEVSTGKGEGRIAISHIPVYGGSVTIYGRHVPPGYQVQVLGETIELGGSDRFVTSRILPPGDHLVDVSVSADGKDDSGLHFERDIFIPDNEWFYVGLADITLGKRLGPDANLLNQVSPDEFNDVYNRGRLAFYVKGKIKGETILTAAFDTTEEELDSLFDNLDRKDPRQLLRNLDPDDYYPVFGDDSTTVEDAPTSGKFFIRLQKGNSHVLWGNFKTRINGTELARFERGLYGAQASIRSPYVTSRGEPVAELEAFAAEPGSLPQRDEFRGTGGSAYFLRRQDINRGSEQVYIEVRNRVSGEVLDRKLLRPDQDYEFDYVQGVVLLRRPLQSSIGTNSAVREVTIGDQEQYLVAVYEYTPTLTDLDGYVLGGRAQVWLGDSIRVGATGFADNTGIANQQLLGADLHIQLAPKSYFQFEWAESEGNTFGSVVSTDGGFIFDPVNVAGAGKRAQAYRGKLAVDLAEATNGKLQGSLGAYYEHREAGFNAPGRHTNVEERLSGVSAKVELSPRTSLRARFDQVERADGNNRSEGSIEVEHRFASGYNATVGVNHSDTDTPIGSTTGTGKRTDVGLRLEKAFDDRNKLYAFGQVTASKDDSRVRNDRFGAGLITAINDKLTAELEASYGTKGVGGLAALAYAPNATDRYYFGYRLDPDTTAGDLDTYDPFGSDYGSIVYGASRNLNDQTKVFFEENYDFTGQQRSLTHTYGITYTPDAVWTITGGFEAGEVYDSINGDFDRVAVSGQISLRDENKNGSLRFEARFEDGLQNTVRDRNTYLLSGQYGHIQNDDWRFIASLDAVISQSNQDTILDGDYVEASIGWAYRPREDDTLNALFRYTYLEDLPGAQQVNVQNQVLGPRQRSHILEADFIYDLNEQISIGGKYGFRIGQVSQDRSSANFTYSSAHLAIARADWHVLDKWDLLGEARALWLPEQDQTNYGFLAGVYRHVGENFKVGVGFNFGQFSDDITDLTYDDKGIFLNVIGKF